jgi:uncharacterized membrane protein YhaH (DUF805 family)
MQPLKIEDILPHLWISGRSSRAEWWRVHVFCGVLAVMVEHAMFDQLAPRADGSMPAISMLWPIASLALAWVSFASVVRRFHDRGKSGWWALLYFVPGIGWLWILVECGFLPGKPAVASTFDAAPAPAPTPAPTSRSAARLQMAKATRAGTVQRAERRPWDRARTMKFANGALRFAIAAAAAVMIYKMAQEPGGLGVFGSDIQPMRTID